MTEPSDTFAERVYRIVRRVPPGRVTTYGDVAAVLGHRRRARRVGWALSQLTTEQGRAVPWQRVINSHGSISLRGDPVRGPLQRALLEAEGIRFDPAGRCELARLRCLPEELSSTADDGLGQGEERE